MVSTLSASNTTSSSTKENHRHHQRTSILFPISRTLAGPSCSVYSIGIIFIIVIITFTFRRLNNLLPLSQTEVYSIYAYNSFHDKSNNPNNLNCQILKNNIVECIPFQCKHLRSSDTPTDNLELPIGVRHINLSNTLNMVVYGPGELISDTIIQMKQTFCPGEIVLKLKEAKALNKRINLLDIGSNIGSCVLLALDMGHYATSIEPMQLNIRLMKESIRLSDFSKTGSLTIYPIAASNKNSEITLIKEYNNSGNNIIINDDNHEQINKQTISSSYRKFGSYPEIRNAEFDIERICTIRLDELAQIKPENFIPDIIKIDVQGHEFLVFEGMKNILQKRTAQYIFSEVWPALLRKKNQNPVDMYSIAINANYRLKAKQKEVTSLEQWKELCNTDNGFDIELFY